MATQFEIDLETLRGERRRLAAENHNLRLRLAQYEPTRGNCQSCGGTHRIDDYECPDCDQYGNFTVTLDAESNLEAWQAQESDE